MQPKDISFVHSKTNAATNVVLLTKNPPSVSSYIQLKLNTVIKSIQSTINAKVKTFRMPIHDFFDSFIYR